MELNFVEPPPSREKYAHDEFATALKASPGEWAKIPLGQGYATMIKNGALVAYRPAGSFETRTSMGELFVRYVGGGDPTRHVRKTKYDHAGLRERAIEAARQGRPEGKKLCAIDDAMPATYVAKINNGDLGYVPVGAWKAKHVKWVGIMLEFVGELPAADEGES